MATPRDYRAAADVIAADLLTLLDSDPDAFDIVLFKPRLANPETVVQTADVVGSIESDERAVEYDDPIPSRGLFLPFDFQGIIAMDSGEKQADPDVPLVMLIKEKDVPKGSVVQYDEYVSSSEVQTISLYVIKSEAACQGPAVAMKHYLIPFFDDEGALTHE